MNQYPYRGLALDQANLEARERERKTVHYDINDFDRDPLARSMARCHWISITVANSPWLRFSQMWIWKITVKLRLEIVHSLLEFMMATKATRLL